jgi:serine/threonine-protein kinase
VAIALALLARASGVHASVTVPSVTGVDLDTARATLRGQGLQADVRREPDSSHPAGTVTDQDPEPHSQAAQNSTVGLTVSSGPAQVSIDPSRYVGRSYGDVHSDLAGRGLDVHGVKRPGSSAPPGTVIAVNPQGSVPKGTTITVTVAAAAPRAPDESGPPSPGAKSGGPQSPGAKSREPGNGASAPGKPGTPDEHGRASASPSASGPGRPTSPPHAGSARPKRSR